MGWEKRAQKEKKPKSKRHQSFSHFKGLTLLSFTENSSRLEGSV